jgi:hypothetical protein
VTHQIVLVLDSKRISRSEACTSGNFGIETGSEFGLPPQPFEHEDEKILANASFITELTGPNELVLSGDIIFVANTGGSVPKYGAKTGAVINAAFTSGLTGEPV